MWWQLNLTPNGKKRFLIMLDADGWFALYGYGIGRKPIPDLKPDSWIVNESDYIRLITIAERWHLAKDDQKNKTPLPKYLIEEVKEILKTNGAFQPY